VTYVPFAMNPAAMVAFAPGPEAGGTGVPSLAYRHADRARLAFPPPPIFSTAPLRSSTDRSV
jgi:hypothetical protein